MVMNDSGSPHYLVDDTWGSWYTWSNSGTLSWLNKNKKLIL